MAAAEEEEEALHIELELMRGRCSKAVPKAPAVVLLRRADRSHNVATELDGRQQQQRPRTMQQMLDLFVDKILCELDRATMPSMMTSLSFVNST